MTVCNSCRYCEGLCAVFPAMEMRRAFSDGDLNYLANLCHGCGACYSDCQFSPPHEYNVNVPKTLAIARAESWAAYAWPRAFPACSRATASRSASSRPRASPRSFSASPRCNDRAGAVRHPYRPRRVLRADAAQRDGGVVRRGVPLRDRRAGHGHARVLARHRRARSACWPIPASLWQAMRDAGELRYLDGGGVGCFNEDERPTDRRRIYHHLTFYGFVLCFAATSRRDAVSLSARARGALSVVGPAGGAGHARRHRAPDRARRPAGGKVASAIRRWSTKSAPAWMSRSSPCCSSPA